LLMAVEGLSGSTCLDDVSGLTYLAWRVWLHVSGLT